MTNNFFYKHPLTTGFFVLFTFFAISSFAIFALVNHERQRDYDKWQITLGVMADTHANSINKWVEKQFLVLNNLSQNGSVQLYTQQLLRKSADNISTEPAQISYLRNLLHATAEKNDFLDLDQAASPIQANITFQANNGMALINKKREIITATPGVKLPDNLTRQVINKVFLTGEPTLLDLHMNKNNQPVIGFLTPVYPLQVQTDSQGVIAVILAFRNAKTTLYPLLQSKSQTAISTETLLVRKDEAAITYLTPLADGTPGLARQLPAEDSKLASSAAIKAPGSFGEYLDYAGIPVLSTSRSLAGLPWVLVQKITVDEALYESTQNRRFLLTVLFLTTLLVLALLVATWWYGSSNQEKKTKEELEAKTHELFVKNRLLDAINENISDFIFLIDHEERLIFANSLLARNLDTSPEDMKHKTLSSILGQDISKKLTPIIKLSLAQEKASTHSLAIEINGKEYVFHAVFSPICYKTDQFDSVLVTLHDVTELQRAQANKANLMQQLIKAMMRAIDLHDPYTANHSAKTTSIAKAIGTAMNLSNEDQAVLETAANLCNIGKLFIAKEILTKSEKLNDAEQKIVQKETAFAAEILASIDFSGPVLETIVQKHEKLDGSGYPKKLTGDAILPTSKILSVANAFVAMISPRAYRDGVKAERALDQLLQEADSSYDRKVIAALFHVAENEIDWSTWDN